MTVLTRRRAVIAGGFAAGILVATACGASGSGSGSGSSSTMPGAGAATGVVHTVNDPKLGTIIVNGKGFTLYRFDADSNHPPASHCTGTCAALWTAAPALNGKAVDAVKGIDHKLIGSVAHPGGPRQLTVAGWPVYTYTHDSKAGQTNGQGVDGTWWAVTATGAKAGNGTTGGGSTGGGSGY